MAAYTLVIGNRNYSSWSLRGWLAAKLAGIAFDEIVIPLDQPVTQATIRRYSPAGRVPVLLHGNLAIWDSLAIGEYLAETATSVELWPRAGSARARARSVSAEMHAGFPELRNAMPMNIRARFPQRPIGEAVSAEIGRIAELWQECRTQFGERQANDQGFLFGEPSLADAMFAPVATRFVSHGVRLAPPAQRYSDTVIAMPAMQEWIEAARREPWSLPAYDP